MRAIFCSHILVEAMPRYVHELKLERHTVPRTMVRHSGMSGAIQESIRNSHSIAVSLIHKDILRTQNYIDTIR